MAKSLFDTLNAEERYAIKQRVDDLMVLLKEWVPRYPCIRATRIPTSALLTATVVPRLSLIDSMTVAQMILWVFGVDDEIDEQLITPAQMQHNAERWYHTAKYGAINSVDGRNELTAILLEMRDQLVKSPLFEPLREWWAARVRNLVDSMAQEYQYGNSYSMYGARTLPSLTEYLRGGIDSIGFPAWGFMVLVLLRDSSALGKLESIDEAIRHASAAVRLYNDVQTLDRELREGGINSVVIAYHMMLNEISDATEEMALSEARQYIWQMANSYAQRCYDTVDRIKSKTGQIEEMISRVVVFHSHYYKKHDYHTTIAPETYQMISGNAS